MSPFEFSPVKTAAGPQHLAHTRQRGRIYSWPPSRMAASRSYEPRL